MGLVVFLAEFHGAGISVNRKKMALVLGVELTGSQGRVSRHVVSHFGALWVGLGSFWFPGRSNLGNQEANTLFGGSNFPIFAVFRKFGFKNLRCVLGLLPRKRSSR